MVIHRHTPKVGGIFGGKSDTPRGVYPQMTIKDTAARNAKPREKQCKLTDEKGLFLLVHPNGSKYWRMKYRIGGKEKTLSIGVYPEISIKDARTARDEARKMIAEGIDPSAEKKANKAARVEAVANSFKAVSIEWLDRQKPKWTEKHHGRVQARLENNVWPWLGAMPVSDIKASHILSVLRRVEERGANYMAGRVRETVGNVMCYAVATGRAEIDPTPSLRGALTVHVTKHMASVTDPAKVGEILRAFDAFTGTLAVRTALLLAPLVFSRPGELRQMRWVDLDLEAGLWELDRGNMKMRRDHIVPLSTQAISLIKEMHPFSGHLEYVFPGARDPKRPMSDAAINAALRRIGIDTQNELTGHGFRAMARTILRERLRFDAEVIECQLSHAKAGALGGAYDRTQFLDERIAMMQAWANYLDDLKAGGKVIRLPAAK